MYNQPVHHLGSLVYAHGVPQNNALLRDQPEDFQVEESLSFSPSGEGEHIYVQIKKRNLTTEQAIVQLSRFANIPKRKIGYAGLKDRNALTEQWLSVDLSGRDEPDWQGFDSGQIEILDHKRHQKKLKRGSVKQNAFCITLRKINGDSAEIERRLNIIKQRGVPNYFGEQRFGANEKNLSQAYQLLCENKRIKNRYLQGLYYSAARAYLFNQVLSHRVQSQLWDQAVCGDALMLDGSRSFFSIDEVDPAIIDRLKKFDIHPTGPLWGSGKSATHADAHALESHALADYQQWRHGLENHNLKQQRRALRLIVREMSWQWLNSGDLQLSFKLPSGAYATSVLREIVLSNDSA